MRRTLKDEPAKCCARILPEGVELSRLHWGGGTNRQMLPADEMRAIAALALFDIAPLAEGGAEFSVEIDPNEIDEVRLDALAEAGMTRASNRGAGF